jgi:hypothetical protein
VVWRRRLIALGVVVAAFAIAWVAVASVGGSDKAEPPPPDDGVARPSRSGSSSRGLHAEGDGRARHRGRADRARERGKRVR